MKFLALIGLLCFAGCTADRGGYGIHIDLALPMGTAKVATDGAWASSTNSAIPTLAK